MCLQHMHLALMGFVVVYVPTCAALKLDVWCMLQLMFELILVVKFALGSALGS